MRDDMAFNVQFIDAIRAHPCLYDKSRRDYNIRHVHEKVWQDIANMLNEPVVECKDRWKNLRGRYSKYISHVNSPSLSKKPVKEYYLAENMSFLYQFLTTRKNKNGSSVKTQLPSSDDDESLASHAFVATELQETFGDLPSPAADPLSHDEEAHTPSMNSRNSKSLRNQSRKFMLQRRRKNLTPVKTPEDADLSFLKSVIPDMRSMTAEQKRRFKIGVLSLAGQILYETNNTVQNVQLQDMVGVHNM